MLPLLYKCGLCCDIALYLGEDIYPLPVRFHVIEYVSFDCLVLVWLVHALDCLVFVGSDIQMTPINFKYNEYWLYDSINVSHPIDIYFK